MMRDLKKYMAPMVLVVALLTLCKPMYCSEQEINYLLIWILFGLPFGISRMSFWMVPHKMDLSGSLGILVFDLIIAGLVGGFIAIWYLLEFVMKVIWRLLGNVVYRI